jgi:hypothetical protein
LDLTEFAARLRLAEGRLHLATPALDAYAAALFDAALARSPARLALAALCHAALHRLAHKSLCTGEAAVGCGDEAVFANAFRRTHPGLLCIARPGLPAAVAPLLAELPPGRRLAAAFFAGPPPGDVALLRQGPAPAILCALLPHGARLALPEATHAELPGFTLALAC